MRFGKIAYANLLPFDMFLKKYPAPSGFKLFYRQKTSYPSKLNKAFLQRHIDAGFISSITALQAKKQAFLATNIGIVATKSVKSVLCFPDQRGDDIQSATSNALAKVLQLQGKILIGDHALKVYIANKQASSHPKPFVDLAQIWYQKERLPFVFGQLCIQKKRAFYAKLTHSFGQKKYKIPHYILEQKSKELGIMAAEIKDYLDGLSYQLSPKAKLGLMRFGRKLRLAHLPPPRRFG